LSSDIKRSGETAAKAKALSAHAEKQKKLQEFVDRQKLDKIVLTSGRKDVQTLAGMPWNNFTASMKKSFMKDNKVAILQTMHNNTDLGKVVANHLNGDEITIAVASTAAKEEEGRRCTNLHHTNDGYNDPTYQHHHRLSGGIHSHEGNK
jgi:hypothetical protein